MQKIRKESLLTQQENLEYSQVVASMKLLGSKFFGEIQTGSNQKNNPRNKTYDVNYVDDGEPWMDEADETAFVSVEAAEEAGLETLLAEGDEDALMIHQFEDSLIESLQSDQEVATCLATYLEARKRISEKVKSRGFWSPKPSKGFSGKGRGKFKGGFKNQFRKPLAQRILESTCRICHQKGHWKAECPMRNKSSGCQVPSGNSAFAGLTVAHEAMTANLESFHLVDDAPPPDATAFHYEETCLVTVVQPFGEGNPRGNRYGKIPNMA